MKSFNKMECKMSLVFVSSSVAFSTLAEGYITNDGVDIEFQSISIMAITLCGYRAGFTTCIKG